MSSIINTILTELSNVILLFVCVASVSYVAYKLFNYNILDGFKLTEDDEDDIG